MTTDLITLLEGAEEGSRELDVRIVCLLSDPLVMVDPGNHRGEGVKHERLSVIIKDGWTDWEGMAREVRAPAYTTSVDSALTLIPDGLEIKLDRICHPDPEKRWIYCCEVDGNGIYGRDTDSKALTFPLAICIAALRSRTTP